MRNTESPTIERSTDECVGLCGPCWALCPLGKAEGERERATEIEREGGSKQAAGPEEEGNDEKEKEGKDEEEEEKTQKDDSVLVVSVAAVVVSVTGVSTTVAVMVSVA